MFTDLNDTTRQGMKKFLTNTDTFCLSPKIFALRPIWSRTRRFLVVTFFKGWLKFDGTIRLVEVAVW